MILLNPDLSLCGFFVVLFLSSLNRYYKAIRIWTIQTDSYFYIANFYTQMINGEMRYKSQKYTGQGLYIGPENARVECLNIVIPMKILSDQYNLTFDLFEIRD